MVSSRSEIAFESCRVNIHIMKNDTHTPTYLKVPPKQCFHHVSPTFKSFLTISKKKLVEKNLYVFSILGSSEK